ncbi:MAG TPA: TolC family protein, partial [Candidatus Acidoferrales bacterium]|nr:TolC family protein [Candidatus Acidoferrales bacterium]
MQVKCSWMLMVFTGGFLLVGSAFAQQPPAEVQAAVVSPGNPGDAVLDDLVREALEKNPGVEAARRRVEALRRRVPQARALPDPTLSVGWMGDIKPFGVQRDDPSSYRSVGAMQEIPFPGKLKLRGQIADREAEAAWWEYEAVRRRVMTEVKLAYFEYSYAHKALDITL